MRGEYLLRLVTFPTLTYKCSLFIPLLLFISICATISVCCVHNATCILYYNTQWQHIQYKHVHFVHMYNRPTVVWCLWMYKVFESSCKGQICRNFIAKFCLMILLLCCYWMICSCLWNMKMCVCYNLQRWRNKICICLSVITILLYKSIFVEETNQVTTFSSNFS